MELDMDSTIDHSSTVAENALNNSSILAVRDLANTAFGAVLPLIDIEGIFVRDLSTLELSSLCCIFPAVRDHFMDSRTLIGTFPRMLDVVSLFGRVPGASDLKPMLETFSPSSVVIRFGRSDRNYYDILQAFEGLRPFYSMELDFARGDLVLRPSAYHVRKLTITQNRWHPSGNAVWAALDGASGLKELVLEHGEFDVVMAAHLEHAPLTHLELKSVSVSQFEIPQLVNWLVTRSRLKDLRIIDFPCWVQPTNDAQFFRKLLAKISTLRELHNLEFSVGGRFMSLGGLSRLRKLQSVRINVEVHLEFSLQAHLIRTLRGMNRKTISIGLYCGRDWSCVHRQGSGRDFIKRLKEKFSGIKFIALDGLSTEDLSLF